MRWIAVAVIGLVLAAMAPTAHADDPRGLALAREVVETAHVGDTMIKLMPTFIGQMRQLLSQQGAVDPKQVDLFLAKFQQRFNDGIPNFIDLVAQVYARDFSDEDLQNLLAFYRSPTGQHLLEKQVVIAQGMAQVGSQWGKAIAQDILAEFERQKQMAPSPKL